MSVGEQSLAPQPAPAGAELSGYLKHESHFQHRTIFSTLMLSLPSATGTQQLTYAISRWQKT